MKLTEAIQKAIEGGYEVFGDNYTIEEGGVVHNGYTKTSEILLDPLFWQSLGKSLGWEDLKPKTRHGVVKYVGIDGELNWLGRMHNFIDHLASGKTIESYFETL